MPSSSSHLQKLAQPTIRPLFIQSRSCDFSHTLSAAGGKVCPQNHRFTLVETSPKPRDCRPLEAKFVQKYGLDANDVQKYHRRRDRWATFTPYQAGSHRTYFSRSSARGPLDFPPRPVSCRVLVKKSWSLPPWSVWHWFAWHRHSLETIAHRLSMRSCRRKCGTTRLGGCSSPYT